MVGFLGKIHSARRPYRSKRRTSFDRLAVRRRRDGRLYAEPFRRLADASHDPQQHARQPYASVRRQSPLLLHRRRRTPFGGKGRKSFPQRISNGSESLFTRQWRRAPSGAKALPLDERALRRRASHSEERV